MKNVFVKLTSVSKGGCAWALAGGLLGVITLLILVVLGVFTRVSTYANPPSDPILTILPWATAPVEIQVEETANQTAIPSPSPTPPSSPKDNFQNGQLVTVVGTEGDGLRLRNQPSIEGSISFLAFENEVFQVLDGPMTADGYQWWYLINPYDASKSGWAVANYLRSIDTP
jgi:hypothetical protein